VTAIYQFGRFELSPATRQLLVDNEPAPLGARAFDVLLALIDRRDRLVTKNELLDLVWPGLVVEENNLQVQISALRKLLGQEAIATIPGHGYRFTFALTDSGAAGSSSMVSTRNNLPQAFSPLTTPSAPVDENLPSIAVLPFVNMSDDAANEYFADGIAEELLNVLSKIRGLRVASHTSAFSFKGSKIDIPTVAQKLNVATVLEGSVRKFGKRVRITVQLVQVATDSHLWSDTYDRELEDIFAVQDDIARSVVKELRSALLGEKRDSSASAAVKAEVQAAAKGRGTNAEAYRLYLQGRSLVARRTQASVATGIEHLRQAVTIDPEYALAWAALAQAQTIDAGSGGWTPYEEGYGLLARRQHARWRWSRISQRGT
jgi:TolB-like protein